MGNPNGSLSEFRHWRTTARLGSRLVDVCQCLEGVLANPFSFCTRASSFIFSFSRLPCHLIDVVDPNTFLGCSFLDTFAARHLSFTPLRSLYALFSLPRVPDDGSFVQRRRSRLAELASRKERRTLRKREIMFVS